MCTHDRKPGPADDPLAMHPDNDSCCGKHETCGCGKVRRPTVLVVDDDPDYVQLLAEAIEHFGKDVETFQARGAEHALATLRQRRIDLIVSDHFLTAGMTGTGLLEAARDISPSTVRVLMTASPSYKVVVGGVNRAKIQAFVTKGGQTKFVVKQILNELPTRQPRAA